MKNIEKKVVSVKDKKRLYIKKWGKIEDIVYKKSGEKLKTNYLKEVITMLLKNKQDSKIRYEKNKR